MVSRVDRGDGAADCKVRGVGGAVPAARNGSHSVEANHLLLGRKPSEAFGRINARIRVLTCPPQIALSLRNSTSRWTIPNVADAPISQSYAILGRLARSILTHSLDRTRLCVECPELAAPRFPSISQ